MRRCEFEKKSVPASELDYQGYKDIRFKKVHGISIESFRSIENQIVELGDNITIIAGKNGTLKSCILGLLAHPFSSPNNATDAFGGNLKTDMHDVFFLSLEKDNREYRYNMLLETTRGEHIKEPIRVYPRKNENRHRVTVGLKNRSGQGNFSLNTAYINLKRLLPIVETSAKRDTNALDPKLESFVANGYGRILQKEAFLNPRQVFEKNRKTTFSPSPESEADYKSISSGEDNIGHILSKMYGFTTNQFDTSSLQGILCIDEIEASLHPVAQRNLLQYLINWSKEYRVQVVVTTHSLFLIQEALKIQSKTSNDNSLVINMISTAFVRDNHFNVIKNPPYEEAYKELTFETKVSLEDVYKINLLCEDEVAVTFLKRIISSRDILNKVDFIKNINSDEKGTSYKTYLSLIKNGDRLLNNSIIVFDPDIDLKSIENNIKSKKVSVIKLPSKYEQPIEKEIVHYIHDLPGDDAFFKKFNKEHAAFCNDFSQYDINDFSSEAILDKRNISKYKNWASKEKLFTQFINYYTKHNSTFIEPFKEQLLSLLSKKMETKGLPRLSF